MGVTSRILIGRSIFVIQARREIIDEFITNMIIGLKCFNVQCTEAAWVDFDLCTQDTAGSKCFLLLRVFADN